MYILKSKSKKPTSNSLLYFTTHFTKLKENTSVWKVLYWALGTPW